MWLYWIIRVTKQQDSSHQMWESNWISWIMLNTRELAMIWFTRARLLWLMHLSKSHALLDHLMDVLLLLHPMSKSHLRFVSWYQEKECQSVCHTVPLIKKENHCNLAVSKNNRRETSTLNSISCSHPHWLKRPRLRCWHHLLQMRLPLNSEYSNSVAFNTLKSI